MKFLFSGLGSSWSLDGKRIARTLRFPNPIPELSEGCLLEYDLDTGENHVLYCPYRPNGPNGMGDSYYLFSIRATFDADYSPDGKYIIFMACRDNIGDDRENDIYRLDLHTSEIEMLTAWNEGWNTNPLWQPTCAICKK